MAKGEGRTFTINTNKDPQTLVEEARKAAEENKADFEGIRTLETSLGRASKVATRWRVARCTLL